MTKEIAAIYCGKLLVVERRIYANNTPLRTRAASYRGMTEAGQFLGRIVLQEYKKAKVPMQLLSPAWYRATSIRFWQTDERPFSCLAAGDLSHDEAMRVGDAAVAGADAAVKSDCD